MVCHQTDKNTLEIVKEFEGNYICVQLLTSDYNWIDKGYKHVIYTINEDQFQVQNPMSSSNGIKKSKVTFGDFEYLEDTMNNIEKPDFKKTFSSCYISIETGQQL